MVKCKHLGGGGGRLLAGSEEGIASNILSDRLKRLVAAGLLTRDDASRGRNATYSLTEQAIQLVPVLAQLGAWGLRHRPTTTRLRVGPNSSKPVFMNELRTVHLGAPGPLHDGPTATQRLARADAEATSG